MAAAPPDGLPISERAAWLAQIHIGVTVPLLVLTIAVVCTRLYARIWPSWRFGPVEWFCLAGFVSLDST